jgi:hypothetical protein
VAAGFLPQALLDAVGQAVDAFNINLGAMVRDNPRVAVADVNDLMTHVFSLPSLKIEGMNIDRFAPGDDPSHLFLADGIHAGTVGQGLIANRFIRAMDEKFGLKIKPFTRHEIVENAGLTHQAGNGKSPFSHTLIKRGGGHDRHAA